MFITKFVQKDRHRCRTICSKARVYTAIGVDSFGYSTFYQRLFSKLGMFYDKIVQGSDGLKDKRRTYHSLYREDETNRRLRGALQAMRIRSMVVNELRDKKRDQYYTSGIGGPESLLQQHNYTSVDNERKMPAVEYRQKTGMNMINRNIQNVVCGK